MKTKYWGLLLGIIVVSCALLSLLFTNDSAPASGARIQLDGELYRNVNLAEDQEFTVFCGNGYNIVTVRDGEIAVTEADCPDQYCVRQGFCHSGVQIVCLPHGLVIDFTYDSEIDGIIG